MSTINTLQHAVACLRQKGPSPIMANDVIAVIPVVEALIENARADAEACAGCNGHGRHTYDCITGERAGDPCVDCADVRALIEKATA